MDESLVPVAGQALSSSQPEGATENRDLKAGACFSGQDLGPADRVRLAQYLDNVREIERRIQATEAQNASGESREMPEAPIGVPDSFTDHVKLMFDLQVVAFASDITRVFSFKMGRDGSSRVYPDSGVNTGLCSSELMKLSHCCS